MRITKIIGIVQVVLIIIAFIIGAKLEKGDVAECFIACACMISAIILAWLRDAVGLSSGCECGGEWERAGISPEEKQSLLDAGLVMVDHPLDDSQGGLGFKCSRCGRTEWFHHSVVNGLDISRVLEKIFDIPRMIIGFFTHLFCGVRLLPIRANIPLHRKVDDKE